MSGRRPLARRDYLTGRAPPHSPPVRSRVATTTGSVITVLLPTQEVPVAKLSFLAGFGAGYVLGARAGRERYEQIRRAWDHAKDDPRLQSLAGMAQARADDAVSSLKGKMGSDAPR